MTAQACFSHAAGSDRRNLKSKLVCVVTCPPGPIAEVNVFQRVHLKPLVNFLMTHVVDIKAKHHYFHLQLAGGPHDSLGTCEMSKSGV